MGNRLSTITTRTGDEGTTGLGDGSRTPKDALRIQALGDVDELNSMLGLLLTERISPEIQTILIETQHTLFDLGSELCIPGWSKISEAQIKRVENAVEAWNQKLPRLAEFILPGGCRGAALAHVCRTIARRAERTLVALGHSETVNPPARQYLNRLSDFFFVLARTLNAESETPDVLWRNPARAEN